MPSDREPDPALDRVPFWGAFLLTVAVLLAAFARVTGSATAAVLAAVLPCALLVLATLRRW